MCWDKLVKLLRLLSIQDDYIKDQREIKELLIEISNKLEKQQRIADYQSGLSLGISIIAVGIGLAIASLSGQVQYHGLSLFALFGGAIIMLISTYSLYKYSRVSACLTVIGAVLIFAGLLPFVWSCLSPYLIWLMLPGLVLLAIAVFLLRKN